MLALSAASAVLHELGRVLGHWLGLQALVALLQATVAPDFAHKLPGRARGLHTSCWLRVRKCSVLCS